MVDEQASEVRCVIFEQRGSLSVVREPGYVYDGGGDVLQVVLARSEQAARE